MKCEKLEELNKKIIKIISENFGAAMNIFRVD